LLVDRLLVDLLLVIRLLVMPALRQAQDRPACGRAGIQF